MKHYFWYDSGVYNIARLKPHATRLSKHYREKLYVGKDEEQTAHADLQASALLLDLLG